MPFSKVLAYHIHHFLFDYECYMPTPALSGIDRGTLSKIYVVMLFIIKEYKQGLKANTWCNPTPTGNSNVTSRTVLMLLTSS